MRFFSDGPDIPDSLIRKRDEGEVVFVCGAGVSMPAGLPSFSKLAQDVIEELGTPEADPAHVLLSRALSEKDPDFAPPMDQVFNLLQRDYGVEVVESVVNQQLRSPKNADLACHSTILRLSKNALGVSRLVTTNFDLLFETGRPKTKKYLPPSLPDIAHGMPLDGIVYLHGRRRGGGKSNNSGQSFVLSSADFGRAYLAEGWATRFVRSLVDRYVVVLLGYTASDPPVRYLLEGLHSQKGGRKREIYAFERGHSTDVVGRWKDRGVQAVAYGAGSKDHSQLWNTLHAWADQADDNEKWVQQTLELARKGPRDLEPYQRGQVASLVSSSQGAKAFADSDPRPPAEWMCVFDRQIRLAKPIRYPNDDNNDSDGIFDLYRIDSDEKQPADDDVYAIGDDFISTFSVEQKQESFGRISGHHVGPGSILPTRLFHLCRWFADVCAEHAAIWWFAGQHSVHPQLLELIHRKNLKGGSIASQAWTLLLEEHRSGPPDPHSGKLFDVIPKVSATGWTPSNCREFELAIQPYLSSTRPMSLRSPLPFHDETISSLREIASINVEYPLVWQQQIGIESFDLHKVFRSARRGLEQAVSYYSDIGTIWWHTATLIPEDGEGEPTHSDSDCYYIWVARLFDRLVNEDPIAAKRELDTWPASEPLYFDKLRMYAWSTTDLTSSKSVAEQLIQMSDESFWDDYKQRELLHAIKAHWNEIPEEQRSTLEERILSGPTQADGESTEDFERYKSITAAKRLGWLQLCGCELSPETRNKLAELRKADESWRESWDRAADNSLDGRGGQVTVNTDPSELLATAIDEIVPVAEKGAAHSRRGLREDRPFQGLLVEAPRRAVAALSSQAKQNRYSTGLWQMALSNLPESASKRIHLVFAGRIMSMPDSIIQALGHYLPAWFDRVIVQYAEEHPDEVWSLWDRLFDAISSGSESAVKSAIGEVRVRGAVQKRSRRTYEHAINSPVGKLVESIMKILDAPDTKSKGRISTPIQQRLEKALGAKGEGRDHAISRCTRRLRWLNSLDATWTEENLVPLFDISAETAEPAWNGYIGDTRLPVYELFSKIKGDFLAAVTVAPTWAWGDRRVGRFGEFLTMATLLRGNRQQYITNSEARSALQNTSDEIREKALNHLGRVVEANNNWQTFGKSFVDKVWPKEVRFQTGNTSRQFLRLTAATSNNFPDAVRTISPFLTSIEHLDVFIYSLKKPIGGKPSTLVEAFPEAVIELLNLVLPNELRFTPHGLLEIIETAAISEPSITERSSWLRLKRLTSK